MKKCMSLIFVLAMMLSLAVAGTVGTSAYSDVDQSKYYGCYATTAPNVDGVIDDVWSTTVPMYFTNETWGYVKLLWSEDAVYLLADLAKTKDGSEYVDFFVTTQGYDKNWGFSWADTNGCHYFRCAKDEDSSVADYDAKTIWYLAAATRATNATAKAIPKADGGFVAEVKIPLGTNDATLQIDSKIGFGASVGGDLYLGQCVGLADLNGSGQLDEMNVSRNAHTLYAMSLHSAPVDLSQTVPATCTTPEQKSYGCSECETVLKNVPSGTPGLDPDNHSGSEVFADNGDGTHSKKWDCCGVVISTEAHTYGEPTIDKQPTCTENGTGSEICTICNSQHVLESIPALGHDLDKSEVITDKEPTCTEKGSKSYHCKREGCDGKGEVTEIDALGHIPGDWETLTAATCSKKGEEYCTCTRCWETVEVREIAMLAHTATEWIVDQEAAPGVAGKRHQQCTVCGALFNEEVIEALPEEKGCGAVVSASALGVYATVALAVGAVWKRKKKKD